jgi:hypothetical protein
MNLHARTSAIDNIRSTRSLYDLLNSSETRKASAPERIPPAMSGPRVSTRLVRSVDNSVRTQLSSFEAPGPERG